MPKVIRKSIPNFITSLNLVSGVLAIVFASNGAIEYAFYAIIAAAIFDFLDGFAARALNAYSEMGKQLDSLCDIVSFGVAPAFVLFAIIGNIQYGVMGIDLSTNFTCKTVIGLAPVLTPVFSALRLAKFNLQDSDPGYFKGLAVPANALFLASLALIYVQYPEMFSTTIWLGLFIFLILLTSALMVSNIPLLSLKFKNLNWEKNHLRFIFLTLSLVAIIWFRWNAFPAIMVIYFVVSLFIKPSVEK